MTPRPRRHVAPGTLRRLLAPVEVAQIRRFGRSLLSAALRTRVLLLHTTGRRSGLERTTALAVRESTEGSLLIVGGAGGQARVPDWVMNLRAEPEAAVTLDRKRFGVRAEELQGPERDQVWDELAGVWPRIDVYQRRSGRVVPVFRLRRQPWKTDGSCT
jgi:deazaflavin-dependent oxidoreductase (nitroreductase family)